MKFLLLLFCILTISCANKDSRTSKANPTSRDSIFLSEGFDTTTLYSDPICLQYKGKPLLTPGQNIKELDTTFSFRYDPNGKYEKHFQTVTDYLSLDDFYSADLSTGSIVGALYFSADKNGRIFRLTCDWTINGDLVDTSGMEIKNILEKKYFPCLPDFKGKRTFELTHKNYTETLKMYPSPDSTDADHGYVPHWSLDYTIKLTKKNGL